MSSEDAKTVIAAEVRPDESPRLSEEVVIVSVGERNDKI